LREALFRSARPPRGHSISAPLRAAGAGNAQARPKLPSIKDKHNFPNRRIPRASFHPPPSARRTHIPLPALPTLPATYSPSCRFATHNLALRGSSRRVHTSAPIPPLPARYLAASRSTTQSHSGAPTQSLSRTASVVFSHPPHSSIAYNRRPSPSPARPPTSAPPFTARPHHRLPSPHLLHRPIVPPPTHPPPLPTTSRRHPTHHRLPAAEPPHESVPPDENRARRPPRAVRPIRPRAARRPRRLPAGTPRIPPAAERTKKFRIRIV